MKQECKDCNKSLEHCTCIEDTIELPNQALIDAAERLKGKELFKESNDRARKILSEIKSLPIQETLEEAAENHAKIFQFPFDCDPAETFITGAKWQQERSYSEEEKKLMIKIFNSYWFENNPEHEDNLREYELSKNIFNQLK